MGAENPFCPQNSTIYGCEPSFGTPHGIVEFRFRLPYRPFSIVLTPAMLVFAASKTIDDDNSAWASYVGIALAGAVVCAAVLSWKVKRTEKTG